MSKKSYETKILKILRNAVDTAEKIQGSEMIKDPKILEIIDIVEAFLKKKKRVCYGGTAINNILPLEDQFYDKKTEFPDYDFYSPNALGDAKELADIYYKEGFNTVEAKAGIHHGTYKVYVNFIPVADITFLVPEIYKSVFKKAKRVAGIYYAPPDLLRMAMYLELSRPMGDISRWEKVLKRLMLLTKHFPLKGENCGNIDIQRLFGGGKEMGEDVFVALRDTLISQDVVFFGAFAHKMYLTNTKKFKNKKIPQIPDFSVLSNDPARTAGIVKERLEEHGLNQIKIVIKKGVGEIIAPHYEVRVGKDTVVFIYKPLACLSFNKIKLGNFHIRVATIDTMLSFYLAFMFIDRPYYDPKRILCMSQFLFDVQKQNMLKQEGILKRFSVECIGTQPTMASIRAAKNEKYETMKKQRRKNKKEWEEWFLTYKPGEKKERTKKKKSRRRRRRRTQTKQPETKKRPQGTRQRLRRRLRRRGKVY